MNKKITLLLIFVMSLVLSGCSLFQKLEAPEPVYYDIRVINGQGSGRYQEGEFMSISPTTSKEKFSLFERLEIPFYRKTSSIVLQCLRIWKSPLSLQIKLKNLK